VRTERVLEDRLRVLADERARLEVSFTDKLRKRGEESEDAVKIRDIRIKSLEG
jgi:hypothetical protein